MNVPKLRFKEFTDEWEKQKIDFFVKESKTKTGNLDKYPLWSLTIENGVTQKTERYERSYLVKKTDNYKVVDPNYYVYNPMNAHLGAIARNKSHKTISVSGYYDIFKINNNNYYFFDNYFVSPVMFKHYKLISTGSLLEKQRVHFSQFKDLKVYLPSNDEQKKISDFLSLLDKKIELQTKKIEDLKLYKLSLRENLFNIFEKEENTLSNILVKWNRRNRDNEYSYVESVSNKFGFIAQHEQFDDRNIASSNTDNYYIIEKGVFAYNPSRLNIGSLALKKDDRTSLVSPLYECFTTNQNKDFLLEWFQSKEFKRGTFSKFEGGVRNTLNFTNLSTIKISLPNIDSQNRIANILNKYNKLIELENKKLYLLQDLKKGLMQNMLI